MTSATLQGPTEFKIEFWTAANGTDRKHRNRYYKTAEGMVRAGARWEAKGDDYWCRYWNGLNTWLSAARTKLAPSHPEAAQAAVEPTPKRHPGRRGHGSQTFSIFGICEAAAAETMLKDGRIPVKIPPDQIPDSALYNDQGRKALFAVIVPREQQPAFEQLCRDLRA